MRRRYPLPPPGNVWDRRRWMRRWARRIDGVVLFVTPLLTMTALLLAVALPYVAARPGAPAPASCTLVGTTWSCPRPISDRR